MREISRPALVDVPHHWNATDLLIRQSTGPGNPALFAVRDAAGSWQNITATEFQGQVEEIAKGLIAVDIEPGDRVAIMGRTSYEWSLVDFAIWFSGAISVPIYDTSSPSQVAWLLSDSGAAGAFVETRRHEEVVRQAAGMQDIRALHVWQFEDEGLQTLRQAGTRVDGKTLESRRVDAGLGDVATIIYTSGTTGKPKGCELSHGNFVELAQNAAAALPELAHEDAQTIMFLPLAHVFARFISIMCVSTGVTVAHTPELKNLLADLQSYKPTFILAVPRVFEKVYNTSLLKAGSGPKGKIFQAGARTAIAWSKAEQAGQVSLPLQFKHALFDLLLYRKIRNAMGGRAKHAVSGGAPLGDRLGHFFHGVGLMVLEGYGLTETTAPITVNTPSRIKIGTVGTPLPGNAVKIAEDGEILAKGVCVFKGYFKRPDLTGEALSDGWFHTGDLGELDDEGFLRITGRKKEIIVTAGGKNVAPAMLEDTIRSGTLVSQCIVLGDQRPFISALITLDSEALPAWLAQRQLPAETTMEQAAEHPQIIAAVQILVDNANSSVSRAEAVKAFRIISTDFTESTGHLTPSLKVKRAQILRDYADIVESIYAPTKTSVAK